jgi:hypothetical protein
LFSSCKIEKPHGIVFFNSHNICLNINSFVEDGSCPFIYARLENKDGSVIYEHSAVNSEILGDRKIEDDSWIRIWSMSKIITISVALDWIEDGILKFTNVKKHR